MMQADDPPFLTVGTEVSAKYKGAFCEAKVNKVVKIVKVRVNFKSGNGSSVVLDDAIKGAVKIGSSVKAIHPDKNQQLDAIITKIQDCSQYTVVFDDGDITTLRRSSLCLKSGRHFAESETLDQLPLTHPEHFGTPVLGGSRRGRRSRHHNDSEEESTEDEEEEEINVRKRHRSQRQEWESDIGKIICVEIGDKKKVKDNWFPGLVVAPTAQDSVKIETKKDFLVRSFQDGRYYTVPKKEAKLFSREFGSKVSQSSLKTAVEKALLYIDRDELPTHWDRDLLFGVDISDFDYDKDWESESSDDEPREEKDHFVAQLYKFMEECGSPINKGPTIGSKDLDLYKLFKVVQKLGGYNRVMNQNQWKIVSSKMSLQGLGNQAGNLVKSAYKRYLHSFDDFYRKLGCTMVSSPRTSGSKHRSGRSLIRVCDKRITRKIDADTDSAEDTDKKEDTEEDEKMEIDIEGDSKKKEGIVSKRVTPLRTMSPTTRDKAMRDSVRPIRLRHLSEKASSRDSSKEEEPKKKGESTVASKTELKDETKKSRVEEIKKKAGKVESESEGETDEIKTKTRSLRNREEKDKETEVIRKSAVEKKFRHDLPQRSASVNSTSSGTSCASTSTSSSVNNLNDGATKGNLKNKNKSSIPDDLKKRGRKKKVECQDIDIPAGKPLLPSHIPICIGDKLKVLYGPNNKESKVTYEAKVLEVDEDSFQRIYYVHYSGWNSRYDEWVVRQRVAENLTWSQNRTKKGRAIPKENEKEKPETVKEENNKEKVISSHPRSAASTQLIKKVNKTVGKLSRNDSTLSSRSTSKSERISAALTRSSVALDKTPRRSTRTSITSSSVRDTEESGSELSDASITTAMSKCSNEGKEPVTVERIGGNSSNGESSSSWSKNIDLKAIESEMKGLDLPVKKLEGSCNNKNGSAKEVTGRVVTVIPASLTITERKQHDPKKPYDSLVKKVEIPVKLVPAQEIMGQIKPLPITDIKKESFLEDDIYEFKEPEPFEFSDIRSRKDGRSKPPTPESFAESEPKVKQPKTHRVKKDSEGSEPDSPLPSSTPQKRYGPSSREAQINKGIDNKEPIVKREVRDYSRKMTEPLRNDEKIIIDESGRENSPPVLHIKEIPLPEGADPADMLDYFSKDEILHQLPIDMKDHKFEITEHSKESHFLSSSVVITPKKMSSKKETTIADDVVITPIKANKTYEDTAKELGSFIYDGASTGNRMRPVSISPIERPPTSATPHVVNTPSHIMAQSVMPPVDSRAIAKPIPRRFDQEKSHSSTHLDNIKTDEKGDGKVIPFSKRQQHIFPHLLNRPDAEDDLNEEVTIQRSTANIVTSYHSKQPLENTHLDPPVLSLPEDPNVSISISSPKGTITTDIDKIAPLADKYKADKKTVEESIEAVIMRATQEKEVTEDTSSMKESPSKPDKRRRNPGRTKKLSRELIPDTSEESDTDSKSDTVEQQQRPKRRGADGSKYSHSPAKKTIRTADASKKAAQRLDEEDRANDADEEDNEGNFSSQKASRCRKKESDDEDPTQKDVRTLKKKRKVGSSRRVDDAGEEIGLGDLLCKEVIPPGSPMLHDYIGIDSSSPIHQSAALKQEMPFASLPTGSSFTKRTATAHPSIPSSLQMSLQQLHPSVCIQAVSKSSSPQTTSNSTVSNASDLQPNVTITTLPLNNSHASLPLNSKLSGSSGNKTPLSVPGGAKLIPTKFSTDKLSKSLQSNNDDSSNVDASSRASSQSTSSPKNETPKVSPPGRPSPLPPVDHTPPTTPESLTSTLSDSPRREIEKYDESGKNGSNYSPEIESDTRVGNCSEDSNIMDSSICSTRKFKSRKRGGPLLPSRLPAPNSQSEGWDTEDGFPVVQKRKKRGSKTLNTTTTTTTGTEEDKESPVHPSSGGITKRRRRRLSSRGEDDPDVPHGLNALSIAACHSSSRNRTKFNFCQEIDPDADADKRISILQGRMQELRRTYMQIKSELASVERRRKKLRRKEKEKETQGETPPT